jgi:hypothetical protein
MTQEVGMGQDLSNVQWPPGTSVRERNNIDLRFVPRKDKPIKHEEQQEDET